MFSENDLIVYGSTGVCRVKSVGPLSGISAAKEDRIYYTLEPLYDQGTIYIPVDSSVFMRPVISKEEALDLMRKIPDIWEDAVAEMNQKALTQRYESAISSHSCEELFRLICVIYKRSQKSQSLGKRPSQTDERYLKRAKLLLYGELSVALSIPYEDVGNYIQKAKARAL